MKKNQTKKQVFSFKPGRRPLSVKPEIIAKELNRIREHDGQLQAVGVVQASRPKNAPLHALFEWDNTAAAEKWRINQAQNIINIIQVKTTGNNNRTNTVPVFLNVSCPRDGVPSGRVYEPVEVAMANPETRRQILAAALRRLLAIRDEYRNYIEFDKVWFAIDSLDAELVKV